MSCVCHLKTGPRAGQPCGAKVKQGKYCGRHLNCQTVSPKRKGGLNAAAGQVVKEYRNAYLSFPQAKDELLEELMSRVPRPTPVNKTEALKILKALYAKKQAIIYGSECRRCEAALSHGQ